MKRTGIIILAAVTLLAGAVFARIAAVRHSAQGAPQATAQTATQQAAAADETGTAAAGTAAAHTLAAGRPASVSITRIAAGVTAGQKETTTARAKAAPATSAQTAQADRPALMRNPYTEDTLYYTNDRDCWQLDPSFRASCALGPPESAMFVDQVRVAFPYAGKTWLLQMRKGQFGFLLLGGEIGLYTAPAGACTGTKADFDQFAVPEESDRLQMSMEIHTSRDGGKTYQTDVRPYETHWLVDGFRKGMADEFALPIEEVKIGARITFHSPEMAAAFAAELEKAGFAQVPAADRLTDDAYCLNGADVQLLWAAAEYDCCGS
ncbi:MAG: DUF4474 domain-containing protein [Clostridia bacterium]|nr:DUF4474 domain-containing protein [Clostridia bacterium]